MSMKSFRLIVATPTGKAFDGEITQISLMGECGSLSVMADHIPFITNVKEGKCRIYSENNVLNCEINGGLLSVTRECVRLITTAFSMED